MLVRIIKALPAPIVDGFDVRHLRAGHVYEVSTAFGRYLILAEYAVEVSDAAADNDAGKKPKNSN